MGRQLQDLKTTGIVEKIFFNPTGLHLETDNEIIDFTGALYERTGDPLPLPMPSGIHAENNCVLYGKQVVLWRPQDYYGDCADSRGGIIALGNTSGGVSFIRIDEAALKKLECVKTQRTSI
jgi:hypothetical protein